MSKASEDALCNLHKVVAEALTVAVTPREIEIEGKPEVILPSAAHLGAAIAFLKNNNITADPATNKELSDLEQALQARRGRRLSQKDLDDAARTFAMANGDLVQ